MCYHATFLVAPYIINNNSVPNTHDVYFHDINENASLYLNIDTPQHEVTNTALRCPQGTRNNTARRGSQVALY